MPARVSAAPPYGRSATWACTAASTERQNAPDELVGWMGDLGMDSLMPLTGKLMYRPAVEKLMLLAPRDAVTRTVIFARFAIQALCRDSGAPRPCSVVRPNHRTRGAPLGVVA